jgi:hypothetical protein
MMWWHKVRGHEIECIHMISGRKPRLWLCSCGKQWHPALW